MKHGIVFTPPDPATLAEWSRLSEDAGFDVIWLADSQSLFREVFTSLAVCLSNTREIACGPCVINPATRHPYPDSALSTWIRRNGATP